jgi:hypothetical protein
MSEPRFVSSRNQSVCFYVNDCFYGLNRTRLLCHLGTFLVRFGTWPPGGRGQGAGGRGQETEDQGRRTEDSSQSHRGAERQRSEDRGRTTDDGLRDREQGTVIRVHRCPSVVMFLTRAARRESGGQTARTPNAGATSGSWWRVPVRRSSASIGVHLWLCSSPERLGRDTASYLSPDSCSLSPVCPCPKSDYEWPKRG